MRHTKTSRKAAARSKTSDFSFDYACALSLRKTHGRCTAKSKHKQQQSK